MLTLYDLQNALSSPNEEIERFKLRLRIPGEFVHIKQIIQDAIEDPYVQLESIDSVDRIKAFDYLFPQLTNRLIKKIVDHPKTFKKVVTRTRYIKDIYWAFKQHSQVFGSLLLRKPEILDDFLLDYKNTLRASELREVLDYFPMLEDACFQYVLNPSVFNRLVQKRGGLVCALAIEFPKYARTFIELSQVLENAEIFAEFIDQQTFYLTPKLLPQYAEAFIQASRILVDPRSFRRWVENVRDIVTLAEWYPSHAGALIQIILNDPNELIRLVCNTNSYNLKDNDTQMADAMVALIEGFPGYRDAIINIIQQNPKLNNIRTRVEIPDLASYLDIQNILQNPIGLRNAFQTVNMTIKSRNLHRLCRVFPQHASSLLQKVIEDDKIFLEFITNWNDLTDMASMPHSDLLIKKVIEDDRAFFHIIENGRYFCRVAEAYPQYADALAQTLFDKPSRLNQIIRPPKEYITHSGDLFGLYDIGKAFPDLAERLIQKLNILEDAHSFGSVFSDIKWLIKFTQLFPHHADRLVQWLVHDPDIFKQLIKNTNDLQKAAEAFPQHVEALIQRVLEDPQEFERLIQSSGKVKIDSPERPIHGLLDTAHTFPEHRDTLFNRVFNDPTYFKRCIRDTQELFDTANAFPERSDALIEKILQDPELFCYVTINITDLIAVADFFPRHADAIIQAVLQNPMFFKKPVLFWPANGLLEIAKYFPNHADALIQKILDDPDTFKEYILKSHDLLEITQVFPSHATLIIDKVFQDPDLCKERFTNTAQLLQSANEFPQKCEELMKRVFNDPDAFKRLIFDSKQDPGIAKTFPTYMAIINQPTVEIALEAYAKWASTVEIKQAARTLWIGRHRHTASLRQLPRDLLIKIAAETRNPVAHTQIEAEEIARGALKNAPIVTKVLASSDSPTEQNVEATIQPLLSSENSEEVMVQTTDARDEPHQSKKSSEHPLRQTEGSKEEPSAETRHPEAHTQIEAEEIASSTLKTATIEKKIVASTSPHTDKNLDTTIQPLLSTESSEEVMVQIPDARDEPHQSKKSFEHPVHQTEVSKDELSLDTNNAPTKKALNLSDIRARYEDSYNKHYRQGFLGVFKLPIKRFFKQKTRDSEIHFLENVESYCSGHNDLTEDQKYEFKLAAIKLVALKIESETFGKGSLLVNILRSHVGTDNVPDSIMMGLSHRFSESNIEVPDHLMHFYENTFSNQAAPNP